MARRYDSRTTIFSQEGRLYQVEYAMEAINHAGQSIGVTSKEGIVLASEKKVTSKLLESGVSREKTYKIDDHILCTVAGITSDANLLINYARLTAQRYLLRYNQPIPVEQLLQTVCDLKHSYTQFGGLRPFGTSFLFAGHDSHYGFQLYQSDPSGNFGGWKATAVGSNSAAAQSILKTDWKEDLSLQDAIQLTIKVMAKTLESTTLTSEKVEFATLTREAGELKLHIYSASEVDTLLKSIDLEALAGPAE